MEAGSCWSGETESREVLGLLHALGPEGGGFIGARVALTACMVPLIVMLTMAVLRALRERFRIVCAGIEC